MRMITYKINLLFSVVFLAAMLQAVPCIHAVDVMINVTGTGVSGYSGDGGLATSAKVTSAVGVAKDAAGNIFFCDIDNHVVRRIDATTGNITTIAGNGKPGFAGDGGPATNAQFNRTISLTFDKAGNLYVTDQNNSRIRKIAADGSISTFAGNGTGGSTGDGGLATAAQIRTPGNIVVDPIDGSVLFSQLNSSAVRRIDTTTNIITTYAGTGVTGFSGDGGPAKSALLDNPSGLNFDSAGNLYIVDAGNSRIRKVDRATGKISTVMGAGTNGFSGDNGLASAAQFFFKNGGSVAGHIALDGKGNFFITDSYNQRIRFVDAATNIITTIAGNGKTGYEGDLVDASTTTLNTPVFLFPETNGNYLVSDYDNHVLRRVVRNSQTLAFSLSSVNPNNGGTGTVTFTCVGSGFADGASVALTNGAKTFTSTSTKNKFGISLTTTLDLSGAAIGTYDVVVTNPGGASKTLSKAFTVAAPTAPNLSVSIVGNGKIRGGKPQLYNLVVTNKSNVDVQNVGLQVTMPTYCLSATLVPPSDRTSLDTFLVPDADIRAILERLVTTSDGNLLDLIVAGVPAGSSVPVLIRITSSDDFKFAHAKGTLNATVSYSPTDPKNFAFALDLRESAGRTQAQEDCVKKLSIGIVDKLKSVDQTSRDRIKASLDKFGFPGIKDFPEGNKKDPCHNGNAEFARLQAVFKEVGIPLRPTQLSELGGAVSAATGTPVTSLPISARSRSARASGGCDNSDSRTPNDGGPFGLENVVTNDPNDKSGPSGPGDAHYFARGAPMTYLIQCENKPEATASVQQLLITDPLDTVNLDPTTINLGNIILADKLIEVPPGLSSFSTDVDLRPAKNLIVRVNAGLQGNNLVWKCTALDPATMQLTADPVLGFLDPDKTPPQGQGSVMFTIKQRPNLAVNTQIKNMASIIFDTNSPVDTPTYLNTISLFDSDLDGDGFPDELELAAKSNPADVNSTPLGGGKAVTQPLTLTQVALKLDFSDKHNDALQVAGNLVNVPAGFNLSGQTVQLFFGGVYRRFTLDDKGASPKSKTESISIKQGKSGFTFSAKISGNMSALFADEGLDASEDLKASKSANRQVQAYVLFNNFLYQQKVALTYGAKKGVSGSAKSLKAK